MQDKPSGAGDERAQTTADEDTREERRILREVLTIYPERLTLDELIRKELADFTKQPLLNVAFHVRALRDHGALGLVQERPARGAVEHFYMSTALVDAVPWAREALGLPR